MSEPYSLLAIDPGSEKSTFLRCHVAPAAELPFGVRPRIRPTGVATIPLEIANSKAIPWIESWASDRPPRPLAVETIKGLFMRPGKNPKVVGRDQLEAQFWAGVFAQTFLRLGHQVERITRATATAVVCAELGGGAKGDAAVRRALVDIYGGEKAALGGGRCKTCKKAEGWTGREHRDCPNSKGGHGATGFEHPPGVFCGWTGSHGFAALAVAIVAAKRIG